jgi:hypothetical protein
MPHFRPPRPLGTLALLVALAATTRPAAAQSPTASPPADSLRAAKLGPRPTDAPRWEYAEYSYDLGSNRYGWTSPHASASARTHARFLAELGLPSALQEGGESRLFTALGAYGWELVDCDPPNGQPGGDVRRCLFKRKAGADATGSALGTR